MAKSRSRGASRGRGAASSASSRSVRSSSRRGGSQSADVEVVEEAGGASWEAGVAFATFIALLVALVMLDMHMSESFDAGKLF